MNAPGIRDRNEAHRQSNSGRWGFAIRLPLLLVLSAMLAVAPANAADVQTVTSPSGISAWLVEDHTTPLAAIRFAFLSGSADEPAEQSGLTNLLSQLLTEGTGGDGSISIKRQLSRISARLSFSAGRDAFFGQLDMLTATRMEAVDILAAAMQTDSLSAADLDRVRRATLAELDRLSSDPSTVAEDRWLAAAYDGHAYARSPIGTREGLETATLGDVRALADRVLTRANLKVVAVGDIDAKVLGELLEQVFGQLPPGTAPVAEPLTPLRPGNLEIVPLEKPEAIVRFGTGAPMRTDPDFMAALVMNEIIGGSPFGSRLERALRTRTGLAYSVSTRLQTDARASVLVGEIGTDNASVSKVVEAIRFEARALAGNGPDLVELEDAKRRIIGSYAFGWDSTARIADNLLSLQLDGLPSDYAEHRRASIEAVNAEAIRRVARELLAPERLWIVAVAGSGSR